MADIRSTLRQALGDGTRAVDFEEFVTFAANTQAAYRDVADPRAAVLLRFIELFSIAAVEGGREGAGKLGERPDDTADVMHFMCTGAAVAVCSAVLSVLEDDIPASALRKIVLGSFRDGLEEVIRVNGLK